MDISKTTIAGYEQLAQQLSQETEQGASNIKPLYRRFEHLNHRVLLHLQDEISELEEELRALDEMLAQITTSSLPEGEPLPPASRRADGRYGADIHFQRAHVLGRIYMKLQQYSRCLLVTEHLVRDQMLILPSDQALSSYSTAKSKFEAASPEDIDAYRIWMNENTPIHPSETRFLSVDHDRDLINPSSSKSLPEPSSTSDALEHVDIRQVVFLLYVTMVLLLLAFSMLPGFLSKSFLLVIVVACMSSITLKESSRNHGRITGSNKKTG
jgi:hypothetical protein